MFDVETERATYDNVLICNFRSCLGFLKRISNLFMTREVSLIGTEESWELGSIPDRSRGIGSRSAPGSGSRPGGLGSLEDDAVGCFSPSYLGKPWSMRSGEAPAPCSRGSFFSLSLQIGLQSLSCNLPRTCEAGVGPRTRGKCLVILHCRQQRNTENHFHL